MAPPDPPLYVNDQLGNIAPPTTVTTTITYEFVPSTDQEITCIICGRDQCDQESTAYERTRGGFYGRVTIGKHSQCSRTPITRR